MMPFCSPEGKTFNNRLSPLTTTQNARLYPGPYAGVEALLKSVQYC